MFTSNSMWGESPPQTADRDAKGSRAQSNPGKISGRFRLAFEPRYINAALALVLCAGALLIVTAS